jgi:hypothetical protein
MGDNRTDLPEGTDTIITGAEDLDTSSANAGATSATGSEAGSDSGALVETGSRRSAFADKLRTGSDKLSGQAADKARGFVGQGLERSAEALGNVSKLVGDTATGLDERLGEEYGEYARKAASAMENAANSLASKDPDELIEDTREFVRRSPGVALAGAAIVGFALARLVKTGLDSGRGRRDDDEA